MSLMMNPKRMLIFVGTRAALERYEAVGVSVLSGALGRHVVEKTLYDFSVSDEGWLAAGVAFVTGYRVPADTFIVFDQSWKYGPDDPYTMQAKARAAASGIWPVPVKPVEDLI